jgi:Transcriptional regulator PadR-like family
MRLFELHRDTDESGVSGTGIVAEGVEYGDGTCAMRWKSGTASTAVYSSLADVEKIHGHGGATIRPLLVRLEDAGWLESAWEEPGQGRVPRRYYRFAAGGARLARAAIPRTLTT